MSRIIHNGNDGIVQHDVTRESRITGATRPAVASNDPSSDRFVPSMHWGPVIASVVIGVALSAMLVIMGAASGLIAGSENTSADETSGILGALGAWTVIAVLIGSFVGSFFGGRLTRWMDRLSLAGHTAASWGLATLVSIALLALVTIAFSGVTTSAAVVETTAEVTTPADSGNTNGAAAAGNEGAASENGAAGGETSNEAAADEAGDALGGAGWTLAIGMLLSLVASAAGWFLGSRRKLADIERENDTVAVA
ncbi:MAG: hypothetical protein JWO69_302 [Thermoleophilia bacterium]|nr:hypothetical protein [Thermoleophilia bacterium]